MLGPLLVESLGMTTRCAFGGGCTGVRFDISKVSLPCAPGSELKLIATAPEPWNYYTNHHNIRSYTVTTRNYEPQIQRVLFRVTYNSNNKVTNATQKGSEI